MKQYILFFDIDGTLFDCAHGLNHVSQKLKTALCQLRNNGHLCFIASGRPYAYLNEEIRNLDFDGFVLCNGAIVLKDNKVLLSHYFDKKVISKIVKDLNQMDAAYCLDDIYEGYCPKKFKGMYDMLESFEVPLEHIISDYDLESVNVAKIEVKTFDDQSTNYIRNLAKEGYELLEYKGFNSFEINCPGVSKGKAILELLNMLNIPVENSIAFGDGENDIEMLQSVGCGIAMGNALPSVKEAADRVTETCVEEGIVKELQRMSLIEEEI